MISRSNFAAHDLRRVIAIMEQLQQLRGQLEAITAEPGATRAAPPTPGKRTLSPAHRRKLLKGLAKARAARWAKAKAKAAPAPKKRRRASAATSAAKSAAAKARWAKFRASQTQ
jgi:hypothetical protein